MNEGMEKSQTKNTGSTEVGCAFLFAIVALVIVCLTAVWISEIIWGVC